MKRFEVTIKIKVRVPEESAIHAGIKVLQFLRFVRSEAEWTKGWIVEVPDSVSSDDVKEIL